MIGSFGGLGGSLLLLKTDFFLIFVKKIAKGRRKRIKGRSRNGKRMFMIAEEDIVFFFFDTGT